MTDATVYFILIYDTHLRHLEVREFGVDLEVANAAYVQIEDDIGTQATFEIVLVGADSLDTIKRTHSPYFATGSAQDIVDDFIAQIV